MVVAEPLGRQKLRAMTQSHQDAVRDGLSELMPRLWRYGIVLCGDADDAGDLAQATAVRALERAVQFTPGTRLDRWCFTILRSIWMNELGRRRTRQGAGTVPVDDVDLADRAPGPEVNILAGQMLTKMMRMPEAQRETLFLVYVEGYSYADAAERLDIPIGTVMSRLANGRKRLQAEA